MCNIPIELHVFDAGPQDPSKFMWNYKYIMHGINSNQLNVRQVNNLINTSGLSVHDTALLRLKLDEFLNPL